MRTPAFLLLLLISILWESGAYGRGSTQTWIPATTSAPSCTLDVVLVTFDDATTPAGGYDYHEHDRPYGTNPGQDVRDRYTLRDFERLFIGGYEPLQNLPFVGDTVTVGNRRTNRDMLPEVFGSVRAYFDSVSNGAFQLHVRMINPADDQGYPRWVELPLTKAHYAEIGLNDRTSRTDDTTRLRRNWFRDDAYAAAWDSVRCWNPTTPSSDRPSTCGASVGGYTIDELPNMSYNNDRRIRHKVLYLYSGAAYSDRSPAGLLHPHAGLTTVGPRGRPASVGYRYVMGEREGWGTSDHDIDEFAGVFTHAHEIGHMLGLEHPGGQRAEPNPYTPAANDRISNGNTANLMEWGLMQGSGAGPQQTDRSNTERLYHRAYRSCPNPINPFYRIDLGWLRPTEITESRDNYVIEPGTVHRITRRTNPGGDEVEYLLERRSHDGINGRSFGRYVSYHEYTNTDPGLFIWRRHSNEERPILIVADGRRIRNARDRDWSPTIHEHQDMRYDPFPVRANTVWTQVSGSLHTFFQDAVNSVDSQTAEIGLRQTTLSGTRDGGLQPDPGNVGLAITEIERTDDDRITVDIHMAPPGPPTNLTVVASNGQATLSWRPPVPAVSGLPRPPPPSYEYQQSIDGGNNWGSATAVAGGSTDARSQTIHGIVNSSDYAFAVRAVNPVGSSAWVHIRPLVLAGPTAIDFPEVVSPEAVRRMVANYTATDPEGDAIEWSRAGTDADDFLLSPNGQLTFGIDPNFEEPPAGEDNTYQVTIQAEAGQQSAALDVEVTVVNADDPGVIVLSPLPPQVGVPFTAELTDPDGNVAEVSWQWQGQAPDTETWHPLSSASSAGAQSSYTPQVAQVGWTLRAEVDHYRDVFGAGKRAQSLATAAVQAGRPTAPENLTAADGDESVTLTWEAPTSDGGAPIEGYGYRYRAGGGAPWQPSAAGTTIKETTFYVRDTISGLTNGTAYTFEVWARNAVGQGAVASVEATPAGVPAPPEVTATPLDGGVKLTIRLTADNGSKITHIDWRNSHLNGQPLDPPSRWLGVAAFAGPHYKELFTKGYIFDWPNLQSGHAYGFEVRVRNRQGASAIVSVAATPQAASPVSVSFDSATYEASEGGAAATVGVRLSETANRTLSIPITITAADHAQRDYVVGGLTAGALWFAAGKQSRSFTLTAKEDADSDDETVALSFGSLPARVVADSTMRQATVTLRDNDNSPGTVSLSSSSPQVGTPLTATLTDPSGGLTGTTWQWQRRSSPTASWTSATGTSAQPLPWISTYTPLAGDGGDQLRATVGYTDADGANQRAESSATEAVRAAPSVPAPTFAHPTDAFRVEQGQTKQITLDAATGTGITYTLVGAPAWIVPRPGSARVYTLQPASTQAAVPYNFTWRATNAGGSAHQTLTITVTAPPPPPSPLGIEPDVLTVNPLTCYVNEYCSFTFPAARKGTEPITYTVSPPSWATASGRSFSGTAPGSPGTFSASLNASNAYGTDSVSLTIKVKRRPVIGDPPVLPAVDPLTCYVNEYCSFTFPAATSGTAPITYRVSPPSWANASGRSFSGTAPSRPGTFSASLNASNSYGPDSESLTINVKRRPVAGVAPVLPAVDPLTCYVNEYCSFTFPAATSGTAPITYTVSPPSWARSSGSRGFSGTAPSNPGTFSASVNASNAYGTDSESLTIKVKRRGYPPVLASVSSITCYVGEYCSFTFPAATSGTAPITYKVSPPSWARSSGSRGFSGTAPSSPGTFSASVNASNAYGTDSESLTIKVKRRLAIAPGAPWGPSTVSSFGTGTLAGRISMPARRPKSAS